MCKLKQNADDNSNMTEMSQFAFDNVEKKKMLVTNIFSFFPTMISKGFFLRVAKIGIVS